MEQQLEHLLIGTYTHTDILAHCPKTQLAGQGVVSFTFDSYAGKLKLQQALPVVNPAVIAFHPRGKIAYLLSEGIKETGEIVLCDIQDDGTLSQKSKFKCSGKSTCYFSIDPQNHSRGIVVNYWDSIVEVVSLDQEGNIRQSIQRFQQMYKPNRRQVVNREDHWKNRQVGPHAHAARFWKNWVFISDLGENAIFQYTFQNSHGASQLDLQQIIPLDEGCGPRHFTFHPTLKIAYISNELNSSVTVFALDDSDPLLSKPRLRPIQYMSTLPSGSNVTNFVSELVVTSDGRFLYCSNRGHDSLACFEISETGELSAPIVIPTGGSCPRHFALSPQENYLLVANQDSNKICIFQRDQYSGALTFHGEEFLEAPNYIKFRTRTH